MTVMVPLAAVVPLRPYIVMAYIAIAYIVMACIAIAYIVMAYIAIAYIVMAYRCR